MQEFDDLLSLSAILPSAKKVKKDCQSLTLEDQAQYLNGLFTRVFANPLTWDKLQLVARYYAALEPSYRQYTLAMIDNETLLAICVLEQDAEKRYIAFRSMAQLLPATRFEDLLNEVTTSRDKLCIYRLFFHNQANAGIYDQRFINVINDLDTTHLSILIQYLLFFTPKADRGFFDFLIERIRQLSQLDDCFATKSIAMFVETLQIIQGDLKSKFLAAAQKAPEQCLDFFRRIPGGTHMISAIDADFLQALCLIVRDGSYEAPVLLQTEMTAEMSVRAHIKLALPEIKFSVEHDDKMLKQDILSYAADPLMASSAVNIAYCLTFVLDAEEQLLLADADDRYRLLYQWLRHYRNYDDTSIDCFDIDALKSQLSILNQFSVDDIDTLRDMGLSYDIAADIAGLKTFLQIRYTLVKCHYDPIRAAPAISFFFQPSILPHLTEKELIVTAVCLLENARVGRKPTHSIDGIIKCISSVYYPPGLDTIAKDIIQSHLALIRRKLSNYPALRAGCWKKLSEECQAALVVHVLLKTAGPFGKKLANMLIILLENVEVQDQRVDIKSKIDCIVSAVNDCLWDEHLGHHLEIACLLTQESALYVAIRRDVRVDFCALQEIQQHRISITAAPIQTNTVRQEKARPSTPTPF